MGLFSPFPKLVKFIPSKHHGYTQLSARRLLVLRHGPSARLQGVAIVAKLSCCRRGEGPSGSEACLHTHRILQNLQTLYKCACSTSNIFRTSHRKNHVRGIAQCQIVKTEYGLTWCGSDPVICSAESQDYLHARTSAKAPSWRPLVP